MHGIRTWHRNFTAIEKDGSYTTYDTNQYDVLHRGLTKELAPMMIDQHDRVFGVYSAKALNGDYKVFGGDVAVVDIDGVIAGHECLQSTLDRAFDKTVSWTTWNSYSLHQHYGVTHEETLSALRNDDSLFLNASVLPDAHSTLKELRRYYKHVALITARGFHHKGLPNTALWLHENGLEYDSLHVLSLDCCKLEYIAQVFGSARIIIEDSPTTVQNASASEYITDAVYCIDQPWNKNIAGSFLRCIDLHHLLHYIEK